jgi:hypothetical protein
MLSKNNNNHRAQHHNVPEGFQKKVENFNKLRPPTFDNSADPMDVDNWLREIEQKLDLTELTEEECVTMAAHKLIDTVSAWWDSSCDSHLDPLHIECVKPRIFLENPDPCTIAIVPGSMAIVYRTSHR